ncbi:MAG TPA: hypothetical protein VER04_11865 [Polyangiaceae bacterium]|nr:hypothetical protein [Polyangiaceae bacterium]
MIERSSGCLRWERPADVVLYPGLTLADFLASDAWPRRELQRDAKPWSIWKVDDLRTKQHQLTASISFHDERLHSTSLAIVDPTFGESWAEWSLERELARKAAHDRLLGEDIGLQRSFVWGTVRSAYDPKSGGSSIVVQYAAQPSKRRAATGTPSVR